MKAHNIDYIIVGLGFAGMAFAHLLEQNKKTFVVFAPSLPKATTTAAALYNPVILKRFTPVWKAQEQITLLKEFYGEMEQKLGVRIINTLAVYRKFASVAEQNNWFVAADNPQLSPFISTELSQSTNPFIPSPFALGEVRHTGRIDTELLATSYAHYLREKGQLIQEPLCYDDLQIEAAQVHYHQFRAKKIVFCEGYELVNNPYFNYLPVRGCKGELLTFQSQELGLNAVIKSDGFVIPLTKDTYHMGATYDNFDHTPTPTRKAREELELKLRKIVHCSYRIIDQKAAIRPTTPDRRPLLGVHPLHPPLLVLNGLGTRGAMLAPFSAKALYNFAECGQAIAPEMNITRYAHLFPKK